MAKKRVALVLSGGVSLGSYIAGALDEILRVLAASGEFEIDVITGASAGATTAAIIAHGLLYRNGETALHDVWVQQVDMLDLLKPELAAGEPATLLSNERLKEVAEQTLTWDRPGEPGVRSPLCASTLTIALTLANVEGLSYISRVTMHASGAEEVFLQHRHAEQETFRLDIGVSPEDPIWSRIGKVAIASAALPFVFPPIPLQRQADNRDHYIQQPGFAGSADLLYSDGGMFNNLPIDLAWHFARQNDSPTDERWIIIVDPSRDTVRAVSTQPPTERAAYSNLFRFGFQMITAMRAESSAIQFDREVLLPALNTGGAVSRLQGALPGLDRANVEILDNVALVLPSPSASRLKGTYLICALSAFLDEKFRKYDFRRGAADARRLASQVLQIEQPIERPEGAAFYEPDADAELNYDLATYEALEAIPSSRKPNKNVREVFEDALKRRIHAIVKHIDPPGPDVLHSWITRRLLMPRLPEFWD